MTDNVPVTPGVGADIATDDVSGVHFQKVKLDLGADGASTPVVGSLPTTEASAADILTAAEAIQAAVESIEGAVGGTEVQVDIVGSLPAGTNNIGDVDVLTLPALPAGTNNIGDVDVASIAAGDNNIGNVDVVTLPALVAGTANIGDVDVLTVPADPFGANADAAVAAGAAGSIQAKLRRLTADLDAVKTAVETLDNTVGGSELQVDVVGSLPAGTANIGDVDVASIAAGDNLVGRVKLSDGTTVATVRELGTNDALNVAIADGSGNQITSFGGGTQYDEGNTDASITGTAILWEDTSDTLRPVSASKPLPIGDAGGSITVDNGGTFPTQATLATSTSGGLSIFMASSSDGSTALTNGAQAVKGSTGQLYGWTIFNPNTATVWVHFYNATTGNVTVGTTNPLLTLAIPASSAAHVLNAIGIAFGTAISVAATSTAGGNGAPTTALDTAFFYA